MKDNNPEYYVLEWGMGDRIITFYKVIKKTVKTIVLREVEAEKVDDTHSEPGVAHYTVKPVDKFKDNREQFRKKLYDEEGRVYMQHQGFARPWDGEPKEQKLGHY